VRHPEAPPSSGIPTSPGSWPYNALCADVAHRKRGSVTLPRIADNTSKWIFRREMRPIAVVEPGAFIGFLVSLDNLVFLTVPIGIHNEFHKGCGAGYSKSGMTGLRPLMRRALTVTRAVEISYLHESLYQRGEGSEHGAYRICTLCRIRYVSRKQLEPLEHCSN
jgi:hypothetical protein